MADAKFIIIDGANFWNMMRILGIGQHDHKVLYEILTQEISPDAPCYGRPVYVLNKESSVAKSLSAHGFEVVVQESYDSRDDREIIRRISQLRPGEVSEIILVAGDGGYVDVLRDKMSSGTRITLVATRKSNEASQGKSMLSWSYEDMFSSGAKFVELEDFKERLLRKPFEDRRLEKSGDEVGVKTVFKIGLELMADDKEIPNVQEFVAQLWKRYPKSLSSIRVEKQ